MVWYQMKKYRWSRKQSPEKGGIPLGAGELFTKPSFCGFTRSSILANTIFPLFGKIYSLADSFKGYFSDWKNQIWGGAGLDHYGMGIFSGLNSL
jgi:hypothetical protein